MNISKWFCGCHSYVGDGISGVDGWHGHETRYFFLTGSLHKFHQCEDKERNSSINFAINQMLDAGTGHKQGTDRMCYITMNILFI